MSGSLTKVRAGPLRNEDGSHTDDIEKLENLAKYYLYAPTKDQEDIIIGVLNEVSIPILSEDHVQALDAVITLEEIQDTIKNLKSNTIPGRDGFTIEFYKTFTTQLSPVLQDLYKECMLGKPLPPSWALAKIILLPKQGRDVSSPKS